MQLAPDHNCPTCGRAMPEHDRHVRFQLPDPVLSSPEQHRVAGAWLSHEDPNSSVMMQIPQLGAFIRALLPVTLTEGYTVTFGVWVGIRPEDLQRAYSIWWSPEYATLQLDGFLANRIAPWDVLGAPVTLAVKDPEQAPYCVGSPHPDLSAVLHQQWPHDILDSLP
jgi:hypothetical protein